MLISTLVAILTLTSCTVTENLTIDNNNGGTSSSTIHVEDFFVNVLKDFSDFSAGDSNKPIMDLSVEAFRDQLIKTSTTSNVNLQKTGKNSYIINYDYSSLKTLLTDLGASKDQSVLTLNNKKLNFFLDINNYSNLTKAIPFLADPNFEPFGPTYNEGLSEADYLEMISFMLGEEGPNAIKDSLITLRFTTPSPIKTFKGGKKISDNTFEYSFPLINFLLLAQPLSFELTW
ncbi:MAG: hypothetical protein JJE21_07615 [Spirochaetaceae bacterium]|nr:hypothetical protein [Spirochaetaceae bacterium]